MNRRRRPELRHAEGFTLIELMITVAIVAILAAIAIPSYQDSIWKGKRVEARAAILRTLQSEERYYTQFNTYAVYASGSAPYGYLPNWSADSQANSRYLISVVSTASGASCTAGDATKCVRVIATVVGNDDPICGATLSMDTIGVRQSTIADARCWN